MGMQETKKKKKKKKRPFSNISFINSENILSKKFSFLTKESFSFYST